ncbi:pentatricopeptide repeat-containing protein [Tanacetum coccineum]
MYCTNEAKKDILDPAKQISKILMSCPKLGVAVALDQSGIRPTPESVEEVLKRFSNAGMLIYQFFDWANMRTKGLLNIETFCIIMRRYARAQKVEEAIYTFNVMEKYNVPPNLAAFNGLLSALCKSKNDRDIDDITESCLISYASQGSAFCKVNKLKNAYRVLNEMESKGVKPNSRTCNILLNHLIERKETDEAFKVFRRMIKICDPDADTYTIMIKMFSEKGDIEMALKVWKFMKKKQFVPSLHTFSVLINGLCEKRGGGGCE